MATLVGLDPLALVDAIDNGRVKPGDTLLLSVSAAA